VEIFLNEEFLYGVVVHHTFSFDPGSDSSVPQEELPSRDTFHFSLENN
jgi:hypothetical protein